MVEKIVTYIISKQLALGNLKKEDISVYRYGYTLFFETIINICIALIIALISGKWGVIFMFLAIFIPLRSFVGGWHADKFWKCTVISNTTIIVLVLLTNILKTIKYQYFLLIEFIFFIIIIFIVPVQNENRRISSMEYGRYKKYALFIWGIEHCVLLLMLYKNNIDMVITILYAHFVLQIAIIGGWASINIKK